MPKKKVNINHKPPIPHTAIDQVISSFGGSDPKLKRETFFIICILSVVTFFIYCGVLTSDFAYYDDEVYVTDNTHVNQGLTWEGFKWAFTSVGYSDNWHPLTWLSHMFDVRLFGLNPTGHHLTNLLLHISATLLLFGFFYYLTGEKWLSAIIAALFAWHPLHVESVAWIAERKDVLSAVLGILALWTYAYYARKPTIKKYLSVIFLFALGLLTKPMLVTLPFVMLLFDFWPLQRLVSDKKKCVWPIIEKIPFFVLVVASATITIIAQKNALGTFTTYALSTRISNAIVSYCVYLGQVVWPGNLAVLYPYNRVNSTIVIFCFILFCIITLSVLLVGRRKKYLITGWFWYIGTLIPVIGLIQVGSQAHADRYTYIPYIGLFLMIVLGLNEIKAKFPDKIKVSAKFGLIIICFAMLIKTRAQVGYWKNGVVLLSHTIAITKNNERAHYNLGNLMQQEGRTEEAITQYTESLKINPNKINALANLAGIYFQMKQYEKAKSLLERAINLAKAIGDEQNVKDMIDNLEVLNSVMNPGRNNAKDMKKD